MVVVVRLHWAYPQVYGGDEVWNSLKGRNMKGWMIEISGLTDSEFLEPFLDQFRNPAVTSKGHQLPVFSSVGNSFVATPRTDNLLGFGNENSMPIPAAAYHLNILEKCGLKVVTQTATATSTPTGTPQEQFVIWTLMKH